MSLKAFLTDQFRIPLPPGHPFPADKYRALRERLQASPDAQWIDFRTASAASDQQLGRVHDPRYLADVIAGRLNDKQQRRIGFPWSPELVERSRRSTGATIDAMWAAISDGYGVNLAGGTHHAFADMGQGFCVFNDIAVAIRDGQAAAKISRAMVVDLDVHQGNGTASIFDSDHDVFTFSMHCEKNYPFRRHDGDLDLTLPEGASDEAYLGALEHAIENALPWSTVDIVFYIAGADPYAGDRLGLFDVSMDALATRDAMVLNACARHSLPTVVVMGGGYASDIDLIASIHSTTVRLVANFARGD